MEKYIEFHEASKPTQKLSMWGAQGIQTFLKVDVQILIEK